jgi:hypothetical protein
MPVAITPLPLDAVISEVLRRGYGEAYHTGYELTFNKPTGKVFSDGSQQRMPLPGLTKQQLDNVLLYSKNVKDAADRVERIMLGEDMAPTDVVPETQPTSGPDWETISKLVSNRAKAEVAEVVGPIVGQFRDVLEAIKAEVAGLAQQIAEEKKAPVVQPAAPVPVAAAPKKRGRQRRVPAVPAGYVPPAEG